MSNILIVQAKQTASLILQQNKALKSTRIDDNGSGEFFQQIIDKSYALKQLCDDLIYDYDLKKNAKWTKRIQNLYSKLVKNRQKFLTNLITLKASVSESLDEINLMLQSSVEADTYLAECLAIAEVDRSELIQGISNIKKWLKADQSKDFLDQTCLIPATVWTGYINDLLDLVKRTDVNATESELEKIKKHYKQYFDVDIISETIGVQSDRYTTAVAGAFWYVSIPAVGIYQAKWGIGVKDFSKDHFRKMFDSRWFSNVYADLALEYINKLILYSRAKEVFRKCGIHELKSGAYLNLLVENKKKYNNTIFNLEEVIREVSTNLNFMISRIENQAKKLDIELDTSQRNDSLQYPIYQTLYHLLKTSNTYSSATPTSFPQQFVQACTSQMSTDIFQEHINLLTKKYSLLHFAYRHKVASYKEAIDLMIGAGIDFTLKLSADADINVKNVFHPSFNPVHDPIVTGELSLEATLSIEGYFLIGIRLLKLLNIEAHVGLSLDFGPELKAAAKLYAFQSAPILRLSGEANLNCKLTGQLTFTATLGAAARAFLESLTLPGKLDIYKAGLIDITEKFTLLSAKTHADINLLNSSFSFDDLKETVQAAVDNAETQKMTMDEIHKRAVEKYPILDKKLSEEYNKWLIKREKRRRAFDTAAEAKPLSYLGRNQLEKEYGVTFVVPEKGKTQKQLFEDRREEIEQQMVDINQKLQQQYKDQISPTTEEDDQDTEYAYEDDIDGTDEETGLM